MAQRCAYPTRAGDLPGVIVQRDRNAAGRGAVCARHRPKEGVVGCASVQAGAHSIGHLLIWQGGCICGRHQPAETSLQALALRGGGLCKHMFRHATAITCLPHLRHVAGPEQPFDTSITTAAQAGCSMVMAPTRSWVAQSRIWVKDFESCRTQTWIAGARRTASGASAGGPESWGPVELVLAKKPFILCTKNEISDRDHACKSAALSVVPIKQRS
jgi:hypothetical protein